MCLCKPHEAARACARPWVLLWGHVKPWVLVQGCKAMQDPGCWYRALGAGVGPCETLGAGARPWVLVQGHVKPWVVV